MRIFRHHDDLPDDARGGVVALGNFDGVHLGHRAIVEEAGREARRLGAGQGVMTLEPHPRQFFRPQEPPFRLTPFRVKARHIEALGVDSLFVMRFDEALAALPAEDFVRRVLVDSMEIRHAVVGYNFAFGHRRQGNLDLLREMGGQSGFGVTCVPPVEGPDGMPCSSTLIRGYLADGEPRRAAAMLGRPWEIDGRVEEGARRGRTIGFPTANLWLGEYLVPALGVYAVRAGVDEGEDTVWHAGAANIGRRPTVDGTGVNLEVHLFDFSGDLYGRHLRVALVDMLRPEKKFDGLDALKAQIARDCEAARRILAAGPAAG